MRIKKHSNKNEYILTEDNIWVRNLYNRHAPAFDINQLGKKDYQLLLSNELLNKNERYQNIDTEEVHCPYAVIVSDGYDFNNKQEMLAKLPKNVSIIATNGALAGWRLVGDNCPNDLLRRIDYFVVNNPYEECMIYLPRSHRYFPGCIASTRTNPQFLEEYRGSKFIYIPAMGENYSGPKLDCNYKIDDYRNPICASIGLACRFGIQKLLMFCCDDSFADERPSAIHLENNLWAYEQQLLSHNIIDGYLYWLKKAKVKLGDHSSGPKLKNATYIETVEDMLEFFEE